jgi:hypothetical protein
MGHLRFRSFHWSRYSCQHAGRHMHEYMFQ